MPRDLLYSVVKSTHDVSYSLKRLLDRCFHRVKIRKKLVDRSFQGGEMTSDMFDCRFQACKVLFVLSNHISQACKVVSALLDRRSPLITPRIYEVTRRFEVVPACFFISSK